MLRPFRFLVFAEVARERFLAPGAVDGVCDGRKGRDGFVFAGVTEVLFQRGHFLSVQPLSNIALDRTYQRQRPVSTHAVTRDADPTRIKLWKRRKDRLGEFLGDVGVHVVPLVVRSLCRVDVEAGAGAEVPRVILAFDVQAACFDHFVQY